MYAAYSRNTTAGAHRIALQRGLTLAPELPSPKLEQAPRAAPEVVRLVNKPEPLPAVVDARSIMRRRAMPAWAVTIVTEVAEKHGVTTFDLIGRSRARKFVPARNEAFYRLKLWVSPITGLTASYPHIAAWFSREHSGVLYGAAKHAFVNGLPPIGGIDVEAKMARNLTRSKQWYVKSARKERG